MTEREEEPVKLLIRTGIKSLRRMLQFGVRICDKTLKILEVKRKEVKENKSH